jgi:hypothetical protein
MRIQPKFKATRVLLGIVLSTATLSIALARPVYHAKMIEQFRLTKSTISIDAGCQYCHSNPNGGLGMNPFGIALDRRLPDEAEVEDVAKALYAQLQARKDSDLDGYDDVLEVVAGTLPGDEKSKPKVAVASLEDSLKKVGGINRFKPR